MKTTVITLLFELNFILIITLHLKKTYEILTVKNHYLNFLFSSLHILILKISNLFQFKKLLSLNDIYLNVLFNKRLILAMQKIKN